MPEVAKQSERKEGSAKPLSIQVPILSTPRECSSQHHLTAPLYTSASCRDTLALEQAEQERPRNVLL